MDREAIMGILMRGKIKKMTSPEVTTEILALQTPKERAAENLFEALDFIDADMATIERDDIVPYYDIELWRSKANAALAKARGEKCTS